MLAIVTTVDQGFAAAFIVGGVILTILAGLVSAAIARRWSMFVLGIVVFVATAIWFRSRIGVAGGQAVEAGYIATLLVGFILRDRDRAAGRGSRGGATWGRAATAAAVGVAVVAVGALVASRNRRSDAEAIESTRVDALSIAAQVDQAHDTSGNLLAYDIMSQNRDVLTADGDTTRGGADLVVRVTFAQYGMASRNACWMFHVVAGTPTQPHSGSCPDIPKADVAPEIIGIDDDVSQRILHLPPTKRTDPASIEAAARKTFETQFPKLTFHADAARIDGHRTVATIAFGVTGCVVTVVGSKGVPAASATEPTIQTWMADTERLRSVGGCRPEVART